MKNRSKDFNSKKFEIKNESKSREKSQLKKRIKEINSQV